MSQVSPNEWLGRRRRMLGLTQSELAKAVQSATITVKRIENGSLRPSLSLARALAGALKIPAAEHESFAHMMRDAHSVVGLTAFGLVEKAVPGLPSLLSTTHGRDREVQAVLLLLARLDVRLVTLTGPPGAGKTRLSILCAHRAAVELENRFGGGAHFVPLAGITRASELPGAIAQSLETQLNPNGDPLPALAQALRNRNLLLVLDNLEQVQDGAAAISALLSAAPGLTCLATSRERLHAYGEVELPVPPLLLPDLAHLPPVEALEMYPAIALFVDRAQAAQRDFSLSAANGAAVAGICAAVDGLPLAIEMAASHVRWREPAAILSALRERVTDVLADGPRDRDARQQSLRGAILWSYALLSEPERALFDALGLFEGSVAPETARALFPNLTTPACERLLQQLADKNLVLYSRETGRYDQLYVLRAFAREQLSGHTEIALLRRRAIVHFAAIASRILSQSAFGNDSAGWMRASRQELPNLQAATSWCLGDMDVDDDLLQHGFALCNQLWFHLRLTGRYRESLGVIERALAALAKRPTLPDAHYWESRFSRAKGIVLSLCGRHEQAVQSLDRALNLIEADDQPGRIASACVALMHPLTELGQCARAMEAGRRAIELYEQAGDEDGIGYALDLMGNSARKCRMNEEAESIYMRAYEAGTRMGNSTRLMGVCYGMGQLALARGAHGQAHGWFKKSAGHSADVGNELNQAMAWLGSAAAAFAAQPTADTGRTLHTLHAFAGQLATRAGGWSEKYHAGDFDPVLQQAATLLGEAGAAEAQALGQTLDMLRAGRLAPTRV